MENIVPRLGRRIRELRKNIGFTQEELGERANLHQTYIGGVERGERNVSLTTLIKLAEALHISLADLFIDHKKTGQPLGDLKALIMDKDHRLETFFNACCASCKHLNSFLRLDENVDASTFFAICCKNCEPYRKFRRHVTTRPAP